MQDFARYYESVRYLEGLSNIAATHDYMGKRAHDPSIYIKRMQWFLDLIGNPELDFKYIHITGTAGKGTVSTTIHKMLVDAGHTAGLFTSPFVISSIEKIQVGELYIAPDEFADIVEELKSAFDRAFAECPYGGPSYFERFLAIAFVYFKKKKCEWVVLEVGCGGRYDATNVIPSPVVSAVTNIDYDHMHILGKTLTKITRDKSGIIKKGSTFFTSEQRPRLRDIMEANARDVGATYHYIKGSNAELVRAIMDNLGIAAPVPMVPLPARFEMVSQDPLVIIDGAHNRAKMRYTARQLAGLHYSKLHVVIALAANKQKEEILGEIVPIADYVYPTKFQAAERKCANPAELFPKMKIYTDSSEALEAALSRAGDGDAILVTGSFYLAGELRMRYYPEELILKNRRSFFDEQRRA